MLERKLLGRRPQRFTRYAGKRAPRPSRPKLSTARVIDNFEVERLREEDAAKEEEKRQREAAEAVRGKAKAAGRGRGASGRTGRRGGAATDGKKVQLQS